ncbi:MAG: VOC family protein [Anaerolineales bacterium]|nr:VOC family protein [Anaerolineales bacterium]
MNHGYIFFEIHVDDVGRAVKFYQTVFGWKMSHNPGVPIEYYDIETGGSRGGLLQRPVQAPSLGQGTNAFICSLEVESFDATAAKILSNGGQVALEKFPVPGRCWQGYFIDTEGNTFGIFEVDEKAGLV